MTAAICMNCGAQKIGALTPWLKCRFAPNENWYEAKAQSLFLSAHYLSETELQAASQEIQAGRTPNLDVEKLKEIEEELTEHDYQALRHHAGCTRQMYGCMFILVIALLALLWQLAARLPGFTKTYAIHL